MNGQDAPIVPIGLSRRPSGDHSAVLDHHRLSPEVGSRGFDLLIKLVEHEPTFVENVDVLEVVRLIGFDVALAGDQKVGRIIRDSRGRQKSA